jgi:hypothetical protein
MGMRLTRAHRKFHSSGIDCNSRQEQLWMQLNEQHQHFHPQDFML